MHLYLGASTCTSAVLREGEVKLSYLRPVNSIISLNTMFSEVSDDDWSKVISRGFPVPGSTICSVEEPHLHQHPMRRIPRPQRAIDASLPVSPLAGHRVYRPTCLRVVSPYNHLRTTSASFSTTPSFSFLLGGKQDKKKHQQFVRRWQKRLLGDSEPIGAHVDPYDPTSPVRIAPDEQGEELEVLEDQKIVESQGPLYQEAHDGRRLRHVGGKEWTEQLEEGILAKEFEKLTLRTYTPLSLKMADQIEDLTGTPYTLRDENLMMAQMFHDFTGKPYTDWR